MKLVIVCVSLLTMAFPSLALGQSAADLKNAANTPDRVLTYGMSYSQQRFSPLKQIDRQTVKRLVPAWSYSLHNDTGEESQALVLDGVMYITSQNMTAALDAESGKEIWRTMAPYPIEGRKAVCCGVVNRGGALYNGKFFRTILDGRVQALDQKTGKEIWNVRSGDFRQGMAMTGAPLVANGVVLTGVAGGEYGVRGYVEGYDPDLDLVYWGTGNPSPWNALDRKGDNLFTDTIMALKPKTGEMVWYYQTSPNDPFDHDNVSALVLAELKVGGQQRKVVMQAARNGFFYVLDRTNGKLLAANKYAKATWADRIDMTTGRPVWSEATKKILDHVEKIQTWPTSIGATNWYPMSFSPLAGLAYVNTINIGAEYEPLPASALKAFNAGDSAGPNTVKMTNIYPDPEPRGYLKAIDPMTGQAKWQTGFKSPNWAGTLVTAGGLVFTGELTGEFIAVDSDTGKILWQFQTSSGIIGQPVTWEKNGTQYVTVTSGLGGMYAIDGDPNLAHVPLGGSLWTFKLMSQ